MNQFGPKIFECIEDHCPICRAQIFGYKTHPLTKRPIKVALPNQIQFRAYLSDGRETDLGMCRNCYPKVTLEECNAIYEGIKVFQGNFDPSLKVVRINKKDIY